MRPKREKVLFLTDPGRSHRVVELDEAYNERELRLLHAALRKGLWGREEDQNRDTGAVSRIVGPGFVIRMLGGGRRVRVTHSRRAGPAGPERP